MCLVLLFGVWCCCGLGFLFVLVGLLLVFGAKVKYGWVYVDILFWGVGGYGWV
jgi:hypothetical protein